MGHEIRHLLQQGINQLGLSLPDSVVVQLVDYIHEFQRWNKMHNLSAIQSLEESVSLHLLDSLAVLNTLDGYLKDKPRRILADLGTGGGLPGIVLALARPDLKITLLEPLERRVNFLEEVKSELGIAFEVKRGKAESAKGQFDVVTGRAVAALPKFLAISWHLVKPGGSILAMKGASAQEEIDLLKVEKLPKDLAKIQLHEITLGELELARIVELAKAG